MLRRQAVSLLIGGHLLRGNEPGRILLLDVQTGHTLLSENRVEFAAPPGSTLKPFVLAGLLKRRRLDAGEPWPCPGELKIAGRSFTCSHPVVAQPMTVRTALAYSCNCFVARMVERYRPGDFVADLARHFRRIS